MKSALIAVMTAAGVATGLVRLWAEQEPNSPPLVFSADPRLSINRVAAAGLMVTIGFVDSGTGATDYRLDSLPQIGGSGVWAEVLGAQAIPAPDGGFRFTVSVGGSSHLFFRVRTVLPTFRDTDEDGLNDDWERRHFGSLDALASGDSDGDGYTHLQEYQAGTDPTKLTSQPAFPLVAFSQADLEAAEGTPEVSLKLTLNKPWTGPLHFAVRGSAVSGSDFDPLPASVDVNGAHATLRLRLRDNGTMDAIRWLRVELVETAVYGAGRHRAVTVTINDNDEVWQGAFASRLGRVNFGLALYTEGETSSGALVSGGGVLPQSPAGGFPLAKLARSSGSPQLDFDSGWLPLSSAPGGDVGILVPGVTHVRLVGKLNRDADGSLTGSGTLEMGAPNQPRVTVPSQSLNLARTPASFVAGQTRFVR